MSMSPKQYQKRVEEISPKTPLLRGCLKAFLVGGAICVLGQFIRGVVEGLGVTDTQQVSSWCSIVLIFLGALVTGLGWYDNLGHFSGAGSIIPITGFSNGIVSSAIEFKKEGFVLGVGAKMFTIAGPVIVYGTVASVVCGVIYWVIQAL